MVAGEVGVDLDLGPHHRMALIVDKPSGQLYRRLQVARQRASDHGQAIDSPAEVARCLGEQLDLAGRLVARQAEITTGAAP